MRAYGPHSPLRYVSRAVRVVLRRRALPKHLEPPRIAPPLQRLRPRHTRAWVAAGHCRGRKERGAGPAERAAQTTGDV